VRCFVVDVSFCVCAMMMMMMIGPYLFGTKKVRMYLMAFHFFSSIVIISEDVGDDLQRRARKN